MGVERAGEGSVGGLRGEWEALQARCRGVAIEIDGSDGRRAVWGERELERKERRRLDFGIWDG